MTRRQFMRGQWGATGDSPERQTPAGIPAPVQRAIDQWIADGVADRLLGLGPLPELTAEYWYQFGGDDRTYMGIPRDQWTKP
jgi:hypothetical protein